MTNMVIKDRNSQDHRLDSEVINSISMMLRISLNTSLKRIRSRTSFSKTFSEGRRKRKVLLPVLEAADLEVCLIMIRSFPVAWEVD